MSHPSSETASPGTPWWRTEQGWQVMLGVFPLIPWAMFHLMEQWTAFGGRAAWLGRMRASSGGLGGALELVVVLSCVAWLVLLIRGRHRQELGAALRHESALAGWLAQLERPAGWLTAVLLLVHAATLWAPRFLGRESLAEVYEDLREATGRWPGLVLACFGITAFVVHVAASLPSAAMLLGLGRSREGRQGTRLVSVGLAGCLLILFTQLAGWHATGTGVVWPIVVVEVADDHVPMD